MPTPDTSHYEAILDTTIARLTEMVREDQRPAATDFLLQVLREDPYIIHATLPLAVHLMKQYPDEWQAHLEVASFVAECRSRAWISRMLSAVPNDGLDAQAEFLVGAAAEIKAKLWEQT